jgi:hypothetical protein
MISQQTIQPGELIDQLCRHLVSFQWIDVAESPQQGTSILEQRKPKAFAVSAFVIEVRGAWFLVTAGHILSDLKQRLGTGRRLVKARLLDGVGRTNSKPPIPFDLDLETCCILNQWKQGFDYGIIPLSPLYAKNLEAGGTIPLSEHYWKNIPDNRQNHVLLGFPTQAQHITLQHTHGGGIFQFELGIPLLPVFPCGAPSGVSPARDQFFARVPICDGVIPSGPVRLTDIDGLSGGPIFGFDRTPEGEIHIGLWRSRVHGGGT